MKQEAMGRRRFLKNTGRTLAAASLAPAWIRPSTLQGQARPAPSDRVVVAVIGTGDLGRRHHLERKLLPNPRIEVVAVGDVDQNRRDMAAQRVKERTGRWIGIYKDCRVLLEWRDIDAALIASL